MTGLAVGSYLIGRYADRVRNPLRFYGFLEIGIGIYAFLIPYLFQLLVPFYQFIHAQFEPSFYVFSLTRFAAIFAILLVPTILMGATLPILSRFFEVPGPETYRFVGLLYGLNTAGAVLGTFSAGFLLLPSYGSHWTNLMAVTANITIGSLVILLSRSLNQLQPSPPEAAEDQGATAFQSYSPGLVMVILIGFFLSGLAALGYEVIWTRVLGLILGPSVYSFSAMLTTFLLGLALGSLAVSKRIEWIKRPALWFAGIQIAVGLLTYGGMALFDRLPTLFLDLVGPYQSYPNLVLAMKFLFSAAVMFVPTLFLGAVFPLVVKICRDRWTAIGRTVGSIYAINTFGAIVGAFLGGFVLLPLLGVQKGMLVLILLNLGVGLFVLVAHQRTLLGRGVVAGLVLPLMGFTAYTLPPWDPKVMTTGVSVYLPMYYQQGTQHTMFHRHIESSEILYYEDGMSATISVHQQEEREGERLVFLRVNGKTDASTGGDMITQLLSGLLPQMLHPDPNSVFVLGMGSGVTVGAVTQTPVQSITAVELEPAVIRATRFFEKVNFRYWEDPRLKLVLHDGRSYLLANPQQYDVIISEPPNPWMAGVANLFTSEFFELVKARLAPRGIFLQWLQQYQLSTTSYKSILGTLADRFPYLAVIALTGSSDTLLLASNDPIPLSPERLQARIEAWGLKPALATVRIDDAYDIVAMYRLGREEVVKLTGGITRNTDDNGFLEYSAPKEIYTNYTREIDTKVFAFLKEPYRHFLTPYTVGNPSPTDSERKLAEAYRKRGAANRAGRPYLALADLQYANQLHSKSSLILNSLANVYLDLGQKAKGAALLEEAMRLDPKNVKPVYNYAYFLDEAGAMKEASDYFRRVLKMSGGKGDLAEKARARLKEYEKLREKLISDPIPSPPTSTPMERGR